MLVDLFYNNHTLKTIEMKTDREYTEQMFGKKQTPRAGFEPTTPRFHDMYSTHWALTEATTVAWSSN